MKENIPYVLFIVWCAITAYFFTLDVEVARYDLVAYSLLHLMAFWFIGRWIHVAGQNDNSVGYVAK